MVTSSGSPETRICSGSSTMTQSSRSSSPRSFSCLVTPTRVTPAARRPPAMRSVSDTLDGHGGIVVRFSRHGVVAPRDEYVALGPESLHVALTAGTRAHDRHELSVIVLDTDPLPLDDAQLL